MSFILKSVQNALVALEQSHPESAASKRMLIALSGGRDSMVLADALAQVGAPLGWTLEWAHLDHLTRDGASTRDADWVRKQALHQGIPCHLGQLDQSPGQPGGSFEMAAREERLAFLTRVAREQDIPVVALGHHLDDQVETFLINLSRGGGSQGLSGMTTAAPGPLDRGLIWFRPLLSCRRLELQQYAESHGLSHIEDASNQDVSILRNRIRHELRPMLEKGLGRDLAIVLPRSLEILQGEKEFLQQSAREWLSAGDAKRSPFHELHRSLQRWILILQAWKMGAELSFQCIEHLRERPGVDWTLPGGRRIRCQVSGLLEWAPPAPVSGRIGSLNTAYSILPACGHLEQGGFRLEWEVQSIGPGQVAPSHEEGTVWLDVRLLQEELRFRVRQAGDRYRPIGWSTPQRLKKALAARRFPREQRQKMLVLEGKERGIVWGCGLPPSDLAKVPADATQALILRCFRDHSLG